MNAYLLWLNIPFPIDEGKVVTNLVAKNYIVSAAADSGKISLPSDSSASLIALKLECRLTKANIIYDDIIHILNELSIAYSALIITEFSHNSIWTCGNVPSSKSFDTKPNKPILN